MRQLLNFAPATWYVLANRSEAAFYLNGSDRKFHFIQRLKNKKGATKEHDLVSDRDGRSASSADRSIRHAYENHESHHEHQACLFAKNVAEKIENARAKQRFDELVLVAEPHFLGLLRQELTSETRKLIQYEIKKEFIHASDAQLRASVLKAIREERKSL